MSAGPPTPPSLRLQSLAVRVLARAHAMGLLPERAVDASGMSKDAKATLSRVLHFAVGAGIGRALIVPADPMDEERWERLAANLLVALEESPSPETEWPALKRVLGAELLASLVGVSLSSVRRYATGIRPTPDDVAARLHFLSFVVANLAGSYNDAGLRRWFARPRAQLGGQAPAAVLEGAWQPDDAGPTRLRRLAASLLGAPAT